MSSTFSSPTFTGIVLVAINPYQSMPLYGPEVINAYHGKAIGESKDAFLALICDSVNLKPATNAC